MISWTTELRDKYRNAVNAGYTAVVISPEGILSLLDALESAEVQADELRIMNGNLRALADEKVDAAGRETAKLCHMTDRADRLADQLSVLRDTNREQLRNLVDLVWNTATESEEVPSTKCADELIDRVFSVVPALRQQPKETAPAQIFRK